MVRLMGGERERITLPLLDASGSPSPEALRAVSILARPRQLEAPPTEAEMAAWRDSDGDPAFLAADVRLLHPELLVRLQRIGEAFPGRPIELISGYRPHSPSTSRHHHGRALDLRVRGVDRAQLRDLAVTFPETGVGWYPNSVFVHVDVRREPAYWVDLSGPGEPPRYVRGARPPEITTPPSEPAPPDLEPTLELIRRGLHVGLPDAPAEPSEPAEETLTEDELRALHLEMEEALSGIRVGGG
ncbi:MAG: DUF882 domain-containing protein [Myxococcota bacterium]|nr:DUF882 domain-containing protein [Myxococcota bacterium]